jgi:hypothetical protein
MTEDPHKFLSHVQFYINSRAITDAEVIISEDRLTIHIVEFFQAIINNNEREENIRKAWIELSKNPTRPAPLPPPVVKKDTQPTQPIIKPKGLFQ